jgi:hypothetical protein
MQARSKCPPLIRADPLRGFTLVERKTSLPDGPGVRGTHPPAGEKRCQLTHTQATQGQGVHKPREGVSPSRILLATVPLAFKTPTLDRSPFICHRNQLQNKITKPGEREEEGSRGVGAGAGAGSEEDTTAAVDPSGEASAELRTCYQMSLPFLLLPVPPSSSAGLFPRMDLSARPRRIVTLARAGLIWIHGRFARCCALLAAYVLARARGAETESRPRTIRVRARGRRSMSIVLNR